MSENKEDFTPVTFERDLKQLVDQLKTRPALLTGWIGDRTFQFTVREVSGSPEQIHTKMTASEGRAPCVTRKSKFCSGSTRGCILSKLKFHSRQVEWMFHFRSERSFAYSAERTFASRLRLEHRFR